MNHDHVVQVVIARPIDQLFTYSLPQVLQGRVKVGDLLLVPFGKKSLLACIISFQANPLLESSKRIREIQLHLSHLPSFSHALLQLMKQIRTYYHCTWGDVFKLMLPHVSMHKRLVFNHHMLANDDTPSVVQHLAKLCSYLPFASDTLPIAVSKKEWKSWLVQDFYQAYQVPDFKEKSYLLQVKRAPSVTQSRKLSITCHIYIAQRGRITYHDLLDHFKDKSKSSIKRALRDLLDADILQLTLLTKSDVYHKPLYSTNIESLAKDSITMGKDHVSDQEDNGSIESAHSKVLLNSEQQFALDQMSSQSGYQCYLLHGVTGSGKTEVYLSMIEHVLAQQKNVLVLLPEIGLTPQTMRRFNIRLNVPVLPWHSQLTPQDKFKIWATLKENTPCVLIGARSALFTPLAPLGLIVVDESHDSSYKQGEGVRYHARDMAVCRAYYENCPIILGSATPSLESIYNTQQKKYQLLTLKNRAQNAVLPQVHIIDLKKHHIVNPRAPAFSYPLLNAIKARLARGEQSILFLNRRGFSQSVRCITCGFIFKCKFCEITMPWHKKNQSLCCHHCDFKAAIPRHCPSCHQSDSYAPIGKGTEKLEEQVQALFPHARVLRLDRDTQLDPAQFEQQMRAGDIDILIGTQMVTKGHDFPKVTLVGVIDADAALDLPDFRASERTYQLLSQVAGRAGRSDLAGLVIIQTYRPHEPLLQAALHHDFDSFCNHEMQLRSLIAYPPFHYSAVIRIESKRFDLLQTLINQLQNYTTSSKEIRMRGPNPAPIQQIRGRRRWMILLLSNSRKLLHQEVIKMRQDYTLYSDSNLKVNIDIDPLDFL
jgi:primosomal protein N' (replication factor Y) (superfamily II helicase)